MHDSLADGRTTEEHVVTLENEYGPLNARFVRITLGEGETYVR